MPKKILTIDDDTTITDLLAMLLRTHGYEVYTANSGEEGYKAILDINPHIVILDLMMPGYDGHMVCKNVRKISNVPILVLSAIDDPALIASALDAGADDYLVKPVSTSVMVAHLNRLIRRTGTLENSTSVTGYTSKSQPQTT